MLTVVLAQGLNQTANIIKGFAIAIGVVIAVGFVWMWWASRLRERRQELSARARAAWQGWLHLAIAHPELANPGPGAHSRPTDAVRYPAFVASLLATADEVLLLEPSSAWRALIAQHLLAHRTWLASPEAEQAVLAACTAEVRALVRGLAGPASERQSPARAGATVPSRAAEAAA